MAQTTKRSNNGFRAEIHLGYTLSDEEHPPRDLVRHAQRAEAIGFPFAVISDHFHPWLDQQGQSAFCWTVIGAVAQATERLRLGTGVTCPMIRYHPAIVAQMAATAAAMMPGRFFLGVGTGENLNEHILGDKWYPYDIRNDMLEEAVRIIRKLWEGEMTSHYGANYIVENARIYTLPDELPDIYVAAAGTNSAELAGRIGDGLITTSPNKEVVTTFERAGGKGKPRYAQMTVCYAREEQAARETAHKWWRNAAIKGELSQELPLPAHFEQAVQDVTEDEVCEEMTCGPDPEQHMASIQEYVEAGMTHIYIHQVGPDQDSFFEFYQKEILPRFNKQYA